MANKIRLTVGGIEYSVFSEDDETYVRRVGDELNTRMDALAKASPFLSTTMVAVMTALDYCDEAKKSARREEDLKIQLKKAVEDAACAQLEADEARREIERLSAEVRKLRDRI